MKDTRPLFDKGDCVFRAIPDAVPL
jgi:hypothetical protein